MNKKDKIKLFVFTNQLLELELDRIEKKYDIDFERKKDRKTKDNIYYPQFDSSIRIEAKKMGKNYEIFYCLEKSIRNLIKTTLEASTKENWWGEKVPDNVKKEVTARHKKEKDSGFTIRSTEFIDFTTFGELGEIIKFNWNAFGTIFQSVKAVEKVMASLNTLRGPIAHCSELSEDEELRLQLTVRDWFRLMG